MQQFKQYITFINTILLCFVSFVKIIILILLYSSVLDLKRKIIANYIILLFVAS